MVTALAGWAFGWLAERSGSLLAPVLAHLAINEAGAVAALAVQSDGPITAETSRSSSAARRGGIVDST